VNFCEIKKISEFSAEENDNKCFLLKKIVNACSPEYKRGVNFSLFWKSLNKPSSRDDKTASLTLDTLTERLDKRL
jgi:hypothetical protein